MAVIADLPRWDMAAIFPSFDSPEFQSALEEFRKSLASVQRLFDENRIDKGSTADDPAALFDQALGSFNALMDQGRTINAYIHAFVTTDSRNEEAQARDSKMDIELAQARKLYKRLIAWIGSQDTDAILERSELARQHEYALHKAEVAAGKMMSPAEESLSADLELSGKNAWSKLHSNVTSQLTVQLELDGETKSMPMSAIRGMAYDPHRGTRQVAYEAELLTWKSAEVPLAAAMNGVKGEVLTLGARRGWESPFEEACFNANIDRETLDAMMAAARESFPTFRRYLRAKARALGLQKLAWFDMFAPLESTTRAWEYENACKFVAEQFGTYSERMRAFAERAFRENWIDAPPAPGKVDGAYCMSIRRDESRILMNYKPAFGSVSTLAHELGHGYHNLCLNGRSWLQRATPMTLAETASIFCETIVRQEVLKNGSDEEKRSVLEASLQGSCQVVVDITSRFLFEGAVFEKRRQRELSAGEMCAAMIDAQMQTYGDGLDIEVLHPYMWAVKGHYYSGRSYYNFPYMFGLLFGLGLYARFRQEPQGFQERYDDLLSSTGLADAWTLGQRFGIDVRSIDFWRSSLSEIAKDVEQFESLV